MNLSAKIDVRRKHVILETPCIYTAMTLQKEPGVCEPIIVTK